MEDSVKFLKQQIRNAKNTVRGLFLPEEAAQIAKRLTDKLNSENAFDDFAKALLKQDELAGVHLLIVALAQQDCAHDKIMQLCLYNKFTDLRALVVLNAFVSAPPTVFKLVKFCEENDVSQQRIDETVSQVQQEYCKQKQAAPDRIYEYENTDTLQTMLKYFSLEELDLFGDGKQQYLDQICSIFRQEAQRYCLA